jgi:hypothetical protein
MFIDDVRSIRGIVKDHLMSKEDIIKNAELSYGKERAFFIEELKRNSDDRAVLENKI